MGGPESMSAIKKGLASGKWFLPYVERSVMRRLMTRDDYHATRDCIILLAILLTTFTTSYYCWQTGKYALFALFFWLHCTFYTSCGDSRSIIFTNAFCLCRSYVCGHRRLLHHFSQVARDCARHPLQDQMEE